MTKQEIEQKQKDGAAYVLANPHLLCEELAEHLGYTQKGLIGRLVVWRKNGLIPANFKKYNCRRGKTGKVNRSGKPLPESERAPRMGWKIRPPKPDTPNASKQPKPQKQPSHQPKKQNTMTTKPLPKATIKPLLLGRAMQPAKKTGRSCSNGRAGVFTVNQNPEKVHVHNRDAGKVLVQVDKRTWKYVDKEKAAQYTKS